MDRSSSLKPRALPVLVTSSYHTPLTPNPGSCDGTQKLSPKPEPHHVEAAANSCQLVFENLFITIYAFFYFCFTAETLLVLATTGWSISFYLWWPNTWTDGFLSCNLSWTMLAFAITFPLNYSISATFKRREDALTHLSFLKSYLINIHNAHHEWDWDGGQGRSRSDLPVDHVDVVHFQICELVDDMHEFLRLPSMSRARHLVLPRARRRRDQMFTVQSALTDRIMVSLRNLTRQTEVIKREGLPANEGSRLAQWIEKMTNTWEKLRMLKSYRTPHATRAFVRFFIYVLPAFFGPYYCYVAEQTGSPYFTLALALFTSMAVMALFNVAQSMEDPFSDAPPGRLSDSVRLSRYFEELQHTLTLLHSVDVQGSIHKIPKAEGGVSLSNPKVPMRVAYDIDGDKLGGGFW